MIIKEEQKVIYNEDVRRAMNVAYDAHKNQYDKAHYPYIAHPLHLAELCYSADEVCVALLHDVLEDSEGWDSRRLIDEGIPERIVNSVELLTRDKTTPYFEYICRLAEDPIARRVKMVDLRHNLDTTRCDISPELRTRYKKALCILEAFTMEEFRHENH